MKKKSFLFLFLASSFFSYGQTFDWVKGISGTSTEVGTSIVVNKNGDIFTAGYFDGTVDFDPSSNTFNLTSAGGFDIFFTKMDKDGNFIWAKSIGGYGNDGFNPNNYSSEDITLSIDSFGKIICSGFFAGTADLDPDNLIVSNIVSNGSSDMFIIKMDTNGALEWVRQIGGDLYEEAISITTDLENNIIFTGSFDGSVDFDPSIALDIKVAPNYSVAFVTKLTKDGGYLWTNVYNEDRKGISITTDISKNILVVFFNKWMKLDQNGNLIFTKSMYGGFYNSDSSRMPIKTDKDENIYIGANQYGFDNNSVSGIFQYNKNGVEIKTMFINNTNSSYKIGDVVGDFVYDIDKNGTIYFACKPFLNCTKLENNNKQAKINSCNPNNPTPTDIELPYQIYKIEPSDNFRTPLSISANSLNAKVNDLFVDLAGNIHLTGKFDGVVDFNTVPNTPPNGRIDILLPSVLTSIGTDSFIEKILNGPLPVTILNFSAKTQNINNLLTWQTSSEVNSEYFEIQKSNDAINFFEVGKLISKGNSNEISSYTFVDSQPFYGINYYRLKQYDIDGKSTFSKIIAIYFEIDDYTIFPNPSKGNVNLRSKYRLINASIRILNNLGQVIYKKDSINGFDYNFEIKNSKGIFFLEIKEETKIKIIKLMID